MNKFVFFLSLLVSLPNAYAEKEDLREENWATIRCETKTVAQKAPSAQSYVHVYISGMNRAKALFVRGVGDRRPIENLIKVKIDYGMDGSLTVSSLDTENLDAILIHFPAADYEKVGKLFIQEKKIAENIGRALWTRNVFSDPKLTKMESCSVKPGYWFGME